MGVPDLPAMDAQRTVPERIPFTDRFPAGPRLWLLAVGAVVGLVAGAGAGRFVGVGDGWVMATAVTGLLAGLAASWSP